MIELQCVKGSNYFTEGHVYSVDGRLGVFWTYDDNGDFHEFTISADRTHWTSRIESKSKFEMVG